MIMMFMIRFAAIALDCTMDVHLFVLLCKRCYEHGSIEIRSESNGDENTDVKKTDGN